MNKQILMTIAAVVIAATTIFAGCEKDKEKVTGVSVCPTATMIYVGDGETLTAFTTPGNADDHSVTWTSDKPNVVSVTENGVVTAHAIGEATITCKTNDGGFTAQSVVVVNPDYNSDDYATLVPAFYYGNMKLTMAGNIPMNTPIEMNNPITVKYKGLNKIKLSVDEAFMGGSIPMKVDCDDAELIKVENGYTTVGETTADVSGTVCPVKIEAIFDGAGKIDMNIYVSDVPKMGNLTINFNGTGSLAVEPCAIID